MSDIELVIKISEKTYNDIQSHDWKNGDRWYSEEWKAIHNGIPLPKGHGRILDEKDILDTEHNDGGWYDLVDMPEYIAGVKPIIEADKGEEK